MGETASGRPEDGGPARLRLDRARTMYERGEVSLGRAADIAQIPVTSFLDAIRREGIPFRYGREELAEDLAWADEA